MHSGEMAENLLCGARSQTCRQGVVQALGRAVSSGHRASLQSSASCQRLLLSAQESGGCWAGTFLRDFHLEHHLRAPDFQFFPIEL